MTKKALIRLQQDMNSVLARLNTLEALTVQQTHVKKSLQIYAKDCQKKMT